MGSVVFVLHSHLPWVLGHGHWPHGESWLFEAAAESYVPLLQMTDRLVERKSRAHLTLGITPVLAESLSDPRFVEGFRAYVAERTSLADRDRDEFRSKGDGRSEALAAAWARFYRGIASTFEDRCQADLLAAFRGQQDAGRLELVTSAATHGYLPLLGTDAAVAAQLRCGEASYRRHFGRAPQGVWLPECAYRPAGLWSRPSGPPRAWRRAGLEAFLSADGLRFFFVDTHLVTGGAPLGTYEDQVPERRLDATSPSRGFSANDVHVLAAGAGRAPVAVLARDPRSSVQVWSADYGYPGDGAYLEFHRKKGRQGLRYWRVTDRRLPLEAKVAYSPEDAEARVQAHASHFLSLVRDTLQTHLREKGRTGVVVAPFDTELFGHWWFEGPRWLEAVLEGLAPDLEAVTASEALGHHPPRAMITLPEGSWGQGGHHWVWLNDDTRWVWDRVYRAEDAFETALRGLRTTGGATRVRILRQAARELLLLEASDWPFLITTVAARDYAEARVRLHAETFDRLLALAERAGAEPLPPDEAARLAEVEARDSLFPDLDLNWWAQEAPKP